MNPCPMNDCGFCYLCDEEAEHFLIEFVQGSGCPGYDQCAWYKANVKEDK